LELNEALQITWFTDQGCNLEEISPGIGSSGSKSLESCDRRSGRKIMVGENDSPSLLVG
jgi:hypothetical protein